MTPPGYPVIRHRIVIKFGTNVLRGEGNSPDPELLAPLGHEMALLHRQGHEVVVCSSGAVSAGRALLGSDPTTPVVSRRAFAAMGQTAIMSLWQSLLGPQGIRTAQLLMSEDGIRRRSGFLSAKETINDLLGHGIIPIINENDAAVTAESEIGNNDRLAATVALMTDASHLLILTDQPGVFDQDPSRHPEAQLIRQVDPWGTELRDVVIGSASSQGTGGMGPKIQAALSVARSGVPVVIASGRCESVIHRTLEGQPVGTLFNPTALRMESRKRWIVARRSAQGQIVVDDGAAAALCDGRSSLLPAGVLSVSGAFSSGDTVPVVRANGEEIGVGVTQYDTTEMTRIRGQHSTFIAETLGQDRGPAIHRRDFVTNPFSSSNAS